MEKARLVLTKNPDHADALMLKAACLVAEKKDREAEQILNFVIEKNPILAEAYFMLANIELKNRKGPK